MKTKMGIKEKMLVMKAARELGYGKEIVIRLKNAVYEEDITRIMATARKAS